MATYTPISHWEHMSLIEVADWLNAVLRVQREDSAPSRSGG